MKTKTRKHGGHIVHAPAFRPVVGRKLVPDDYTSPFWLADEEPDGGSVPNLTRAAGFGQEPDELAARVERWT